MKPAADPTSVSADAPQSPTSAAENEATGVPGFPTWNRLYALVLVWFVVVVAFLVGLTVAFS